MMATIRNKIEAVQHINTSFSAIAKYCWVGVGVFFVSYLYFIGAITFSVIKEQGMERSIKGLVSEMSKLELQYLSAEKNLTEDYAQSVGLTKASLVSYATARQAFAWNFRK